MACDPRPNVLLICCDHLCDLDTRPGGSRTVMTPTFEQLARNGVHFSNCYSAHPVCVPARRTLLTGRSARSHGNRRFLDMPLPPGPTIAQAFRDAGYQAQAVGKLHVHPQRCRAGFDEVILNEEGRMKRGPGQLDDYEMFLAERGHAGQEYASGLCHSDFMVRSFHLPDDCHPTNWTAREACRMIQRRDPTRPAFWFVSFTAPHPPMYPLAAYLDLYRDVPVPGAAIGDWARDVASLPFCLRRIATGFAMAGAMPHEFELARRAFYALVTHVDHQIRLLIGTLYQQKLLDNTIIAITSDHGEMLGDHGMWNKCLFYERSARVPLIISPRQDDPRLACGTRDDRIVELRDIMPTLLDLAGLPIPRHVEGVSLLRPGRRDYLFGELWENEAATRMIRDERFKLIYYPCSNRLQLFETVNDPCDLHDLAGHPAYADTVVRLRGIMIDNFYGSDLAWLENGDKDGKLIGEPEPESARPATPRHLYKQRGIRFI